MINTHDIFTLAYFIFQRKNMYLYILIDFVLVNFRHIKYVPDFRTRIIMS